MLTKHMLVGDSALRDSFPQSLNYCGHYIRLALHEGHWRSLQGTPNTAVCLTLALVQFDCGCSK